MSSHCLDELDTICKITVTGGATSSSREVPLLLILPILFKIFV